MFRVKMKPTSLLFCSVLLFFKTIAATKHHRLPAANIASPSDYYPSNLTTTLAPIPTTSTIQYPQAVVVDRPPDASIDEVILTRVNANGKTEADIVDMIVKYAHNYKSYNTVRFATNGYFFEEEEIFITPDTDPIAVKFHNFRVNSSYPDDHTKPKFSTLIKCRSPGTSKVDVALPDLEIQFNVSVLAPLLFESSHGSVSIYLEKGILASMLEVQGSNSTSNTSNISSSPRFDSTTILNEVTKFTIAINAKHHTNVYSPLKEAMLRIKSSLEKFFTLQLNQQIQTILNATKRCWKDGIHTSNSTEIYVITDKKISSIDNVNLTVGPATIEGLTRFNRIDFHIQDTSFQNFNNIACSNDLSLRFAADSLAGKMQWNYSYPLSGNSYSSSKQLTYQFSVEYFEIDCNMKPFNATKTTQNLVQTEVEIKLGEIRVATSELNRSEDEKKFIEAILSNNLRILISQWLQKSVAEKIMDKIKVFNCTTGPTVPPIAHLEQQ